MSAECGPAESRTEVARSAELDGELSPALHSASFLYALHATVAFREAAHVTGTVLGRMEDANGRHYEVQYVDSSGRTVRRWFREKSLCAVAERHKGAAFQAG